MTYLLFRLARAAGGGMREAQTLLDQLIAMSEESISEADLNLLLGAARGEDLDRVIDSCLGQEQHCPHHTRCTLQMALHPTPLSINS